ncbi:MAG: hypothetical protein QOJ19_1137 [Acidimicrobiia bacterium]|jgi:hypothetical protein|nr:hypothetical protein [Acidimicrobiia bacterium]
MAESSDPPSSEPTLVLERWNGPWAPDDPDANFKAEVAAYGLLDPLKTLRGMSANTGIPVGALGRYVLARWATAGSEGLLHMGGSMVERMWASCEAAESADSDQARLEAYGQLRQIVSWLRVPLHDADAY